MYRIDNAFAAATLPAVLPPGPVPNGFFQSGNPSTGQKATTVDRDWANAVQEEIATVIERAGLTLSKTDHTQLWEALRATGRWKLNANLDLYVSNSGNDTTGDGLTPGTAYATLQHVWNYIQGSLDLNFGYIVTVHIANGTYAPVICNDPVLGPPVRFTGNTTTPSSVVISSTGGPAFGVSFGANVFLSGVRLQASTGGGDVYAQNGFGLSVSNGGQCTIQAVDFGACANGGMSANSGGSIGLQGSGGTFSVSAGGGAAIYATTNGVITLNNGVCTVTGTPAFSLAFCIAQLGGVVQCGGLTFSGTATGTRYSISVNGVCVPLLGTYPSFAFPGSVAGSVSSGGQYV